MWKALDSEKNGTGHPSDLATDDQVHNSSQHDDLVAVEEVNTLNMFEFLFLTWTHNLYARPLYLVGLC